MLKRSILVVLVGGVLAVSALAAQQVVTLKNGRKITGEVTKTAGGYEVRTDAGVIVLATDQVASVEEYVSPEDEYKQRLAKIDPKSAEAHFDLGDWAMGKGLLEEARTELKTALAIQADHERAKALLKQVEARIAAGEGTGTSGGGTTTTGGGTTPRVRLDWLVSMDDVYKIRLAEFSGHPDKENVRVAFRNDVLKRFLDLKRGRPPFDDLAAERQFLGLSSLQKARYMVENIGRDNVRIRDDILVKSDPRFMIEFRKTIWPVISQYCATAQCHGGAKPVGGLKLFKLAGDERVDYTNFVLIDGTERRGWRYIDRSNPKNSLLLEYGLPLDQARVKHAKKITPPFASRKAGNYLRVLAWIEEILDGPRHPDYRLKYQPPLGMKISTHAGGGSLFPESTTAPAP